MAEPAPGTEERLHGSHPEPSARPAHAATDGELVRRSIAGDATAFEALMRRYNQRLFRTARGIDRSDAEAEDAVQEAWLRAWRGLPGWRAESRLSTWLVRIAANEALGRLRRRGAEILPLEAAMLSHDAETQSALTEKPEHGPEEGAMRAQVRRLMEARIDRLPEAFRTVFLLRAVEEMPVGEVAEALDIPEATVRTRFFRARSLLRESLAREVDAGLAEAFAFDGARCDRIVAKVRTQAEAEGLARF